MDLPKLGIKTKDLIDAVEACLKEARENKGDLGAVNWADLHVTDVEYRLSMLHPNGGPHCVVLIEEASPNCKLASFIGDRIRDRFPNICIECEW